MTILAGVKADIHEEDISYRSSISEELLRKVGSSINAINHGAMNVIGDFKPSFLPLAAFQALHDTSWVLINGADITMTDYGQFLIARGLASGTVYLPDMRGQIPIGINNGRSDGKQNTVVPGLGLGQQMGDGNRLHSHDYPGGAGDLEFNNGYTALYLSSNNSGIINRSTSNSGQNQTTVNSVGVNWFIKVWSTPPTT